MSEIAYFPVKTLADLDALDEKEIVEGYFDGRENAPQPKGNRSRSYWHGWQNGMSDFHGRARNDEGSHGELVHQFIARGIK